LVDRIDRDAARSLIDRFLVDGRGHQIVTINTDFARLADHDSSYRDVLNRADLAVADGMPLVWLSRLGRSPLPERIAGIDLIDDCCELAAARGIPVFLLGAGPGIAPAAARALVARHPGLRIAGTLTPPYAPATTEGDAEIARQIVDAGPALLFVAFGAPRQDRFIAEHLGRLCSPVAMGVGGSLDILAGAIPRAPRWMRRVGFEWLWRFAQEPRRLWRRYLVQDLPFLASMYIRALRGSVAVDG
jgi:N-acetylglucosaminyldiphosphoundecaprenol N-acetyl-beta-D-mannosaminyltransferase